MEGGARWRPGIFSSASRPDSAPLPPVCVFGPISSRMEQGEGVLPPGGGIGGSDRRGNGGTGAAEARQNAAEGDGAPLSWERAQERAGLLGGGGGVLSDAATPDDAPPLGFRPSIPWHAMEIHSSDDGSGHYNGGKAAAAASGVAAADAAAALQATDATERLLPPLAAASDALPGGITAKKRLYMVVIFALTASLLNADQNLMAPNLTAIAAGAWQVVAAPNNNANSMRSASAQPWPSPLPAGTVLLAFLVPHLWPTVLLIVPAAWPTHPCRLWLR